MKTIRTFIVMIAMIVTFFPTAVFADVELPETDDASTETVVEGAEMDVAMAEEPSSEDEDASVYSEEPANEEHMPVLEEQPEPVLSETASVSVQQEEVQPSAMPAPQPSTPYEVAAERVRASSKYASLLDLAIPEGEANILFDYLTNAGVISSKSGEVTFLYENGCISCLITTYAGEEDEEEDPPEVQEAEVYAPEEQVMEPAAVYEPVSSPAAAPDLPEEGSDNMPTFSFFGSLALLIGAVRHIISVL